MPKSHININNDDDTKFVPTPTAWGELYGQWRKPLVRSLSKYGSPEEIEEAVHEAFLKVAGLSPDGKLVEMVELPSHPYFIACQFHPEFKSRPTAPHPLFLGLVSAALKRRQ